jgi:hypothetical protein
LHFEFRMDAWSAYIADASVWLNRGERVIGDFRRGKGGGAEERRLARVWFPDYAQ